MNEIEKYTYFTYNNYLFKAIDNKVSVYFSPKDWQYGGWFPQRSDFNNYSRRHGFRLLTKQEVFLEML